MTISRPRSPSRPPLTGIVGTTASGKTDLAVALAHRLPIEIIVADSRQVYRGMDVGTAKVTRAVQERIPHHLLDLVDPDERFTVAQWVEQARALASQIAARGNLPMLVGGTGLYVSALIDGHEYSEQATSPELRVRLSERLAADGLEPLAAELVQTHPAAAARTDLRNPRRVLRALERGRGAAPRSAPYPGRIALIGLSRPRETLYRRIDERARWLFEEAGLLEEVQGLLDAGFAPGLRPMTGHGYGEAARHLAGEWSLEQAIEVTARRTRQYGKRQLTWFRREPRVMWLAAGDRPGNDPALVRDAERLLRAALS